MTQQNEAPKKAVLRSATLPDETQRARFLAYLTRTFGEGTTLAWVQDESIHNGFTLQVGTTIYDWSAESRLEQFKDRVRELTLTGDEVIPLMRKSIEDWLPEVVPQEIGHVLTVGDGIATVDGLEKAFYGEVLIFSDGILGMVLELRRDEIACILFGDDSQISEGSVVHRTGLTAGMPVGKGFIGHVVNALGEPIDGAESIPTSDYLPIEAPAPEIIDRGAVCRPLETGLLAIDSMFPIGRGQRELIIGDRQTGKTAIALDAIVNQKGKNCICIYVAIGQKESSVAQLVENLKNRGAMDYTIVVSACAGDPASLQYIAPYAGCTLGEYFMHHGQDVLIVYDDLSKHAVAYRQLSLLLERAPGREAYPGDVFYLHSRLLERAAQLSEEQGGGSMTALPIVETQAGDVSAYIPTNVISITDGQIYLESDLFNQGFRPAVNVGISVSRVGGSAQIKSMKKVAGTLKIDMAQYRELESFSKFSSDMDAVTAMTIDRGRKNNQLLIQPQYSPMPVGEQVAIIYCGTHGLLHDVPVDKVRECQNTFFEKMRSVHSDVLEALGQGKLDDSLTAVIEQTMADIAGQYKK